MGITCHWRKEEKKWICQKKSLTPGLPGKEWWHKLDCKALKRKEVIQSKSIKYTNIKKKLIVNIYRTSLCAKHCPEHLTYIEVQVAQLCPTLCGPMDCSVPGSSVHGILQARILEWVAVPFSRGSSQPRDWIQVSCIACRFFTVWAAREALTYTERFFNS